MYGVEVFGGKGAPRDGAAATEPAPYVDYSRKKAGATLAEAAPGVDAAADQSS